jgi:hypothetical protein
MCAKSSLFCLYNINIRGVKKCVTIGIIIIYDRNIWLILSIAVYLRSGIKSAQIKRRFNLGTFYFLLLAVSTCLIAYYVVFEVDFILLKYCTILFLKLRYIFLLKTIFFSFLIEEYSQEK